MEPRIPRAGSGEERSGKLEASRLSAFTKDLSRKIHDCREVAYCLYGVTHTDKRDPIRAKQS